jgi:acyl transferase domain-containing protein
MANQGFLSANASCKTFSADADGYARAEGIVAVYIKPLKDALRVCLFSCPLCTLSPQIEEY